MILEATAAAWGLGGVKPHGGAAAMERPGEAECFVGREPVCSCLRAQIKPFESGGARENHGRSGGALGGRARQVSQPSQAFSDLQ